MIRRSRRCWLLGQKCATMRHAHVQKSADRVASKREWSIEKKLKQRHRSTF